MRHHSYSQGYSRLMGWDNANNLTTRVNAGVTWEGLGGKAQDLEMDNCEVQVISRTSFVIMQLPGSLNFNLLICKMGLLCQVKGIHFICFNINWKMLQKWKLIGFQRIDGTTLLLRIYSIFTSMHQFVKEVVLVVGWIISIEKN